MTGKEGCREGEDTETSTMDMIVLTRTGVGKDFVKVGRKFLDEFGVKEILREGLGGVEDIIKVNVRQYYTVRSGKRQKSIEYGQRLFSSPGPPVIISKYLEKIRKVVEYISSLSPL